MPDIPTNELELYWLNEAGISVRTRSECHFVATDYSRYKHGATARGAVFAAALEGAFHKACPHLVRAPNLLIASPPYKYVPTAAHALASIFMHRLNQRRSSQNIPQARLVKIDRLQPSPDDYGQFSAEQRRALMRTNPLSVDAALVQDSHLLLIDDIKVTGAHQDCLVLATSGLPLLSRTFLHIAKFLFASPGALDPTIEDRLNHAFVKKLGDLIDIFRGPDFRSNSRVCRFLLNARNRAELPVFLARMPDRILLDLYENSGGDGYDLMDAYRESHEIVQMILRRRRLPLTPGLPTALSSGRCSGIPSPTPIKPG